MALLTLTVNNPSPALDKQHQESSIIDRALDLAKTDIRSHGGKRTSGNIVDSGGAVLGTWIYTPVAAS